MSFEAFMKRNKIKKPNTKFVATKSLVDENGKPLEWEIKALTTREAEKIREACTIEIPVKGKPGMYRPKLNTDMYTTKMVAAAIVYPDLYNAELQNSYGVATPEDLIKEMVDNPAEYMDMVNFVQNYNGFETMQEKVDEAKN
jgi:hypothetical protein